MMERKDLRKQELFEDLSDDQVEGLRPLLSEVSAKGGETIFREGEEATGIYLVRSGRIAIAKATEDQWRQRLAVLEAGDFFGELSIMEEGRHEADASALEDSALLVLSRENFENLQEENLELAFAIMKRIAAVMSRNLKHMNERFMKALINY
jgi:CRP-like cAMP-binding protein